MKHLTGNHWLMPMQDQPHFNPMGRTRRIHFVGIGGAGMGGIAEVLLNLGYGVSGSDLLENAMTERLRGFGAHIAQGHGASQVVGADAVVISSAVTEANPEVVAAREARIPVVPRAEMLSEIMRFRWGIAVAGTHGKTTTTSLIASLLGEAGLDPTFVIGGRLNSTASHARLGQSQYLVAEADESDGSFLHLNPVLAVITNIDADHMETYHGDMERLRASFSDFLHHVPFYGLAVVCGDDPGVQAIHRQATRRVRTYGFGASNDIRAQRLRPEGMQTHFEVLADGDAPFPVTLNLPGRHNVLNALAAIGIARELGVSVESIRTGLARFEGIGRRLQSHGEHAFAGGHVLVLDDYGHHPRELEAVFATLRAGWPNRRLVVVFQPHRFTRTRDLFDDFVTVLREPDALFLTPVYPAGEAPIPAADSAALARSLSGRQTGLHLCQGLEEVPARVIRALQPGDVLCTLGAGNIGGLPPRLIAELSGEADG